MLCAQLLLVSDQLSILILYASEIKVTLPWEYESLQHLAIVNLCIPTPGKLKGSNDCITKHPTPNMNSAHPLVIEFSYPNWLFAAWTPVPKSLNITGLNCN